MCSAALFMSPLTNDSCAFAMLLSGSPARSPGACAWTDGTAASSSVPMSALSDGTILLIIDVSPLAPGHTSSATKADSFAMVHRARAARTPRLEPAPGGIAPREHGGNGTFVAAEATPCDESPARKGPKPRLHTATKGLRCCVRDSLGTGRYA